MAKTMLKFAAVIWLGAIFCGSQALAQAVPKRQPEPAPAVAAPTASAAAKPDKSASASKVRKIVLTLNKAEVLTLSKAVRNIVVGNETVANVYFDSEQPTKVFIVSQAVGSTNVFFMGADGQIIEQAEIAVVYDHGSVQDALKKLLPDENIKVTVYRDSVFLGGTVRSASAAANAVNIAKRFVGKDANVVNMINIVGGRQVILQVRVAQMDRNITKEIAASASFSKRFRPLGKRGISLTGSSTVDSPFVTGTLFTRSVFGDPTFQALEEQNLAKTLAEPTLTAVSGETASFLSGGEFPFPSGLDENGQTIFEFREFGIRLNFTPEVLDDRRISMKITTEVSAKDTTNTLTITSGTTTTAVPGLSTKRTDTTIEIPSGGTLMISGLLKDDISDTVDGVPYLKDVPVLGTLFRSTAYSQQETELIVTVTAYLAKPIESAAESSLPTDGFEPASDLDIYLLGRLHRHYSNSEQTFFDEILSGPFGYIMK